MRLHLFAPLFLYLLIIYLENYEFIIFNSNQAHRVQSRILPFQFVTLQEWETRLPLSLIYLCIWSISRSSSSRCPLQPIETLTPHSPVFISPDAPVGALLTSLAVRQPASAAPTSSSNTRTIRPPSAPSGHLTYLSHLVVLTPNCSRRKGKEATQTSWIFLGHFARAISSISSNEISPKLTDQNNSAHPDMWPTAGCIQTPVHALQ